MSTITSLFIALGGLGAGIIIGRILLKKVYSSEEEKAREQAAILLKEAELKAESIKKDKIIEAKEQFLKLKAEYDEEANRKKNQIIANENRLRQREQSLSKQFEQTKRKEDELDSLKENLAAQIEIVNKRKADLEKTIQDQVLLLEKVANLSADDARNQLVETLKDEAQTKASIYIKDILEEAKMTATKQAKKVVIETIQRTATESAIEKSARSKQQQA
jgi:ribonuclease Y